MPFSVDAPGTAVDRSGRLLTSYKLLPSRRGSASRGARRPLRVRASAASGTSVAGPSAGRHGGAILRRRGISGRASTTGLPSSGGNLTFATAIFAAFISGPAL